MSIIGHIKAGRVRIYKLNTYKTVTKGIDIFNFFSGKKNAFTQAQSAMNAFFPECFEWNYAGQRRLFASWRSGKADIQ